MSQYEVNENKDPKTQHKWKDATCPMCNGKGKNKVALSNPNNSMSEPCPGCGGKGKIGGR